MMPDFGAKCDWPDCNANAVWHTIYEEGGSQHQGEYCYDHLTLLHDAHPDAQFTDMPLAF